MNSEHSNLDQALCGLRQSVQQLAERVVGPDVADHLKQSAAHVILAAQASVDRLNKHMDTNCHAHSSATGDGQGQGQNTDSAGEAESDSAPANESSTPA